MMESFRMGRTIYPDAMAKELTYTPSGSLYWPSPLYGCHGRFRISQYRLW